MNPELERGQEKLLFENIITLYVGKLVCYFFPLSIFPFQQSDDFNKVDAVVCLAGIFGGNLSSFHAKFQCLFVTCKSSQ